MFANPASPGAIGATPYLSEITEALRAGDMATAEALLQLAWPTRLTIPVC